ncbi:hypothetical protein MASR2M70_03650 [Bacillota bacterium]
MTFQNLSDILMPGNMISRDSRHKGFLDYLVKPEESDAVIFGVPFDAGTQRHVGTNEGPIGVRRGLSFFRNWSAELKFAFTDYIKTADIGNVDVLWNDYGYTFKNVDKVVKTIVKESKVPIMIGGDHSVTYQAIKSVIEESGKKIGLIWLDNHLDTMSDYRGDIHHCGTPLYHLMTEFPDNISAKNIVHLGSRGFQLGHTGWEMANELGFHLIGSEEIKFRGVREVVKEAIELASSGVDAIYMTLDIDVADAIVAPGTQCNNPGGLNSSELLYIIREVAKHGVIGFDVMEVAPRADVADVTIQLGACAILECLSGLAWKKKENK